MERFRVEPADVYTVVNKTVLNNEDNYTLFDLNKKTDDKKEKYRLELIKNQLRWLTNNKKEIMTKSRLLYNLYKNDKLPRNVKDR